MDGRHGTRNDETWQAFGAVADLVIAEAVSPRDEMVCGLFQGTSRRRSRLLVPALGELGGQQDRLHHAARIGGAAPRNVKGGAVINGGANDREADGDID